MLIKDYLTKLLGIQGFSDEVRSFGKAAYDSSFQKVQHLHQRWISD